MRLQMSFAISFLLFSSVSNSSEVLKLDTSVREVLSYQTDKVVFRAIRGDHEIYPYLLVEKIDLGLTEGDLDRVTKSVKLQDFKGAEKFKVLEEGSKISGLKWQKEDLYLSISNKGKTWKCIATIETETLKCK